MKTVIVTGAAGNLGRAVVKKFLAENYYVAGTINEGSHSPDESNRNLAFAAVDLEDEKEAEGFVAKIINERKTIDVAVLTVGGFAMDKLADTSIQNLRQQFRLNFETAFNSARPIFLQMIRQGGGSIFVIGSGPGSNMKKSKGTVAYGLSKSLVFRLAELMNEEGKNHNVLTTVIVPSIIDTPQNRAAMPDADFSKWNKAEDIAEVIFQNANNPQPNKPIINL